MTSPLPVSLTPEQEEIVRDRSSRLQVIACAGSGKTRSIAARVAVLIHEGAPPDSIVAFTFTERAATELKERIYQYVAALMGEEFLGRLGPMFVGTIHGFCFRLLQDHAPRFGNHDVLDEHRHAALLSRRRTELGLENLHARHWESIRLFNSAADAIANEMIPLEALDGHPIADCYRTYLSLLERRRFLTFGQIVAQAVETLETDPVIRERVRGPLRHLIVDEYQDVNPAQERLIANLAQEPVQLCVVGDDDQAIYQWRGSDVGNIVSFTQRYPGARSIRLEENYRSRPDIVSSANRFARTIPGRLDKAMDPNREPADPQVVLWNGETPEDEAAAIAAHMEALHAQGWCYRDMAVLFRSVRTSAPLLVTELTRRGIPFSCGGRTGLFAHPEIVAFGELFAWMAGFSWKDEKFGPGREANLEHVTRCLAGAFGVPPGGEPELQAYFEDWKRYHAGAKHRVNLIHDYYRHLEVLGVGQLDPDTALGSTRLGALARFSRLLADYEHVVIRSRWEVDENGQRQLKAGLDRGQYFWLGLANYMVHYAKEAYEDFEGEELPSEDVVSILTVHQAKGLEWPVLFLPAMSKLRFPSTMAGRSQQWALPESAFPPAMRRRYEGSEDDERRLFYVALTRAREVVYASTFQHQARKALPSPFLVALAQFQGLNPEALPGPDALPYPPAPQGGGEPELKPLELGFSSLADFEDCGYGYRLSTVFGFERELAQELGYGKAVHHVLRHLGEFALAEGRPPSKDEMHEIVERELYVPYAGRASFDNMRQSVLNLTGHYLHDWAEDLRRIWASERPFEIHFEGGILSGRADVILDREDGQPDRLAIVDYKTTATHRRDERYALQLQVYAAAGRQEGLDVAACYLHDLSNSRRDDIPAGEGETRAAVEWAARKVEEIRARTYTARPEREKCKSCDMNQVCRHWTEDQH